jgi:hypothetical protein
VVYHPKISITVIIVGVFDLLPSDVEKLPPIAVVLTVDFICNLYVTVDVVAGESK